MFPFKKQFEIRPVIEQKPFENPAVQSFFARWCEINDSIQLQIINRDEWERRGIKNILKKQSDGKLTLFIPNNLQLWEIVGIIEVVDQHTFATKPEKQKEAKEKLLALAKVFRNAGIYIAKRLGDISKGREIAEALALEFYEYGQALGSGEKPKTQFTIDNLIAAQDLTPEETEEVDRFLAGDKSFESRRRKVEEAIEKAIAKDPSKREEKRKELYENARKRTLAQFFKVAQKAFELERKSKQGELRKIETELKPWQSDTPIHSAFLQRIEKAITQKIETPKIEFTMAIFRRGLETLVREMRETKAMMYERIGIIPGWLIALDKFFTDLGVPIISQQKRLIDALGIQNLKTQLEEVRKTRDIVKISQMEREIADIIQEAVSSFPYKYGANNPSEMIATQYINCVGASILGGALMKEAGLNYLVGDVPKHSILLLVTSDGDVEWRDMLMPPNEKWKLTDEMIEGSKEDGTPLTINDIVAFSQNPTSEGLMFDIKNKKLPWIEEGQRQYLAVFGPEYGQQIQLLNNAGVALGRLNLREEAIEAYQQAIALNPKLAYPYYNLGNALYDLGLYEKAIETYQQAIAINPKAPYNHYNLGNALSQLHYYEQAVDAYQREITINPKYIYAYYSLANALVCLRRYEEAIKTYEEFIRLADKENDSQWIELANKIINDLKSKLNQN